LCAVFSVRKAGGEGFAFDDGLLLKLSSTCKQEQGEKRGMDDSNSPTRMAESQRADFERQSARVVWTDVRSSLKKSMKGVAYHKWIDRLDLVAEVDGEVLLAAMDGLQAPNGFGIRQDR
jgi:hypothetical protein